MNATITTAKSCTMQAIKFQGKIGASALRRLIKTTPAGPERAYWNCVRIQQSDARANGTAPGGYASYYKQA